MYLSKSALNSTLLICEKFILLSLSFAVSLLLARKGGPELFGQFASITAFAALFSPFAVMGLNNIVTRYVARYPNNSHFYVQAALIVRFVGSSAAIIAASVLLLLVFPSNQNKLEIILLVSFQAFNCLLVYEYFFLAKNKVATMLAIRLSVAITTSIIKILIVLFSPDILLLIFVQGIELALIGVGYHWVYKTGRYSQRKRRPLNWSKIVALAHKGKWLMLSGIAAVFYMKIDQVMLSYLIGNKEVAYYAAAAKLSEFWYAFPVLIANAYTAKLIDTRRSGLSMFNNLNVNLLSRLIAASFAICLITFVLSDWVILTIFGEEYSASASILSIHIFASLFVFQRAIFSKWLIINNLLKYSLVSHGIGAIANIMMNALLIPILGGVGAAWATLVSYIAASYIALFFSQNTRPFAMLMTRAMVTWPQNILNTTK